MKRVKGKDVSPGPVIDRLIHEPIRLEIMTLSRGAKEVDFLFVSTRIGVTRGNLSSHGTRLENAGDIKVREEFVGRTLRTWLRITSSGEAALMVYRTAMRSLLAGK